MNLKKLLGLVAICIFAKFRPARCGVAPVRNAASCDAEYHPAPPPRVNSRAPNLFEGKVNARFTIPKPQTPHCENERSSEHWNKEAQTTLFKKLLAKHNVGKAKNVIMFLGDGMSISTVTAAAIEKGQHAGKRGEEEKLSFEEFPYTGLSKTYCVNRQVADSACSATAYLCGIKANFFTIGVNANVEFNDCKSSSNPNNHVDSIAAWAQAAGKATGIVTTTTVTHASPSGAYAHVANRLWESDNDVKKSGNDPLNCQDIAQQLVLNKPGRDFNVILGGGTRKFIPNTQADRSGNKGERLDGVNLIKKWQSLHENAHFVDSSDGLRDIVRSNPGNVLGLFAPGQMSYYLDRNETKEPTLPDMTEVAIKLLQRDDDGFFLFVEGGRIDHAHHESKAKQALWETIQMAEAIERALQLTNSNETLIVVTSDHSHTMTIAGYPERGNKITGLNSMISEIDNKPYTTLTYANGVGVLDNQDEDDERRDLSEPYVLDKDYRYDGAVPLNMETHAGEHVGIFASGPFSHLFSGVLEQNVIPHLMGFAACIGSGFKSCDL